MSEYGTENLEKCLDVLVEGGNVAGKAMEDGKIEVGEAALLLMLLDELTALSGVDFKMVPKEIGDLDSEEIAELSDRVQKKFDIPQDETESLIEDGVELLARLGRDGVDVFSYAKRFKKQPAEAPSV